MTITFFLLLTIVVIIGSFKLFKSFRRNIAKEQAIVEFIFIGIYLFCILLFILGSQMNSAHYSVAIDPVDGDGYEPFASKYSGWLVLFFFLSLTAQILIWLKGKSLPPLVFVCTMSFMYLGMCINIPVFMQLMSYEDSPHILLVPLPICYFITTFVLWVKVTQQEVTLSQQRTYKNKFLNKLNLLMAKSQLQSVWIVVLMLPLFVIIMCVLTLLGQDPDALTKAFTDTTLWTFSQKTHPPYLDHRGHYLCTVAACGDPELVKPVRLGYRHGHEIIINRQLQIANAFEELIEQHFSAFHKIIRHSYDKYGYPLSKKITTPFYANLTYRLMKPLEYFFLIVLYSFCTNPEENIKRQYKLA